MRRIRFAWVVFCFGFLLFGLGRMAQAVAPALMRSEPTEIDDAYRYLAQAHVMAACFAGDCPALQSIEEQLELGAGGSQVAFNRLRTDIHLFTYFHPLFSLALNGFRALGLGASPAFTLVSAGLGLMVVAAVALWLLAVWGPAPAGVALVLIAFYPLPGQGMHFVPGTIALGWAALTWSVILRRKLSLYVWLPVLWLASLATHPMGMFYVTAALLMLLGMSWPRLERPDRRLLIVGALLFAARLVLAGIVPSFGLSGDVGRFYAQGTSLPEAAALGLADLWDWVGRWGATYWRLTAAALLVAIGLLTTIPSSRRRVWVTGLALLAILVASLLYHHPVHGSTATGRIWGCVAFFLAGAIGSALVFGVTAIAAWWSGVRPGGLRRPSFWLRGAGLVLFGLLVLRTLATNLRYSLGAYPAGIARATTKDNLGLGGDAVFAPLQDLRPDQSAVFLDELSLYSGLAHGTTGHGMIFLPILPAEPGGQARAIDEAHPQYAVGLSPVARLPRLEQGAIPLLPGIPFEVSGPPSSPGLAWGALRLENTGRETMLHVQSSGPSGPRSEQLRVPAGFSGWLSLPEWLAGRPGFTLTASEGNTRLRVNGLRIEGETDLNWPWERGVVLRAVDPDQPGEQVAVELTISDYAAKLGLPLEVMSDEYSLVVARVRP